MNKNLFIPIKNFGLTLKTLIAKLQNLIGGDFN